MSPTERVKYQCVTSVLVVKPNAFEEAARRSGLELYEVHRIARRMNTPNVPPAAPWVPVDILTAIQWGANCGPAAIAAITDRTLAQVRPHLGDFEARGYMNPTQVLDTLGRMSVACSTKRGWPTRGLVHVQWSGRWNRAPIVAQYRHTHWIGVDGGWVYDVNRWDAGGWMPEHTWMDYVVPEITASIDGADGRWWMRAAIEVQP